MYIFIYIYTLKFLGESVRNFMVVTSRVNRPKGVCRGGENHFYHIFFCALKNIFFYYACAIPKIFNMQKELSYCTELYPLKFFIP